MCLLVSQPKTVSFTDAFLEDVYQKNRDGLGIMYAEGGKLHVYKCLPANEQDFVDFYRKHGANRDCIWHARMKTHGDIDMDNCHPYMVTQDIWLAHNGILSSGNDADESKSDTWHFIKHVIRPALTSDPDLMLDKQWVSFIGSLIGSGNKFGLMRADGKSAIVNRSSGVEFMQSWVSNTYAWSPHRFGAQPQGRTVTRYNGYDYSNWQGNWQTSRASNGVQVFDRNESASRATRSQIERFIRAAYNQWTRRGIAGIEQWVYDAPDKAAEVLAYWYDDVDGIDELPYKDPSDAAVWIEDLFQTDSVTPSWLA